MNYEHKLRGFLIIVGVAAIIFGFLSAVTNGINLINLIKNSSAVSTQGFGYSEGFAYVQTTVSNGLQDLAIGGICLFLAHKIKPFGGSK